jgi:hypothetical protein
METYILQKGETLETLAQKFNIHDPMQLRAFHNKYCKIEELIDGHVKPGITLHIPKPDGIIKEPQEVQKNIIEEKAPTAEQTSTKEGNKEEESKEEKGKEDAETQQSPASEHEGKHFVVQKGKAQCNQGNQFPQFKVSSHQKHYLNDGKAKVDNLAVTENDLQFTPPGPSFGQCKLKPSSSGYFALCSCTSRKMAENI